MGNHLHPTNRHLEEQIAKVDKKVETRHRSVMGAIAKVRVEFAAKLEPVVEYINGQKVIEQYKKDHPEPKPFKNGEGKLNRNKIIELLVQAVVSALTIIGILLGVDKLGD